MPIPREFKDEQLHEIEQLELSEVKLLSNDSTEFASLLNAKEYQPDDWKSYMSFKIGHSLPVVSGPLANTGNLSGYHPKTVARSFTSLLHQQINLGHMVKRYDPDNIPRDRIIGCVIAVQFPSGSWDNIPDSIDKAPCISCVGSIFKQAEGVPKLLGNHLTSKEKQSVSIETVFPLADCSLYLRAQKRVVKLIDADDEMWKAIKRGEDGRVRFGEYRGEQMVLMPGGEGGVVAYQGVGTTPNPAEPTAEITDVRASRIELPDGVMAMAASSISMAMFQRGVKWLDVWGRTTYAKVLKVHTSGTVRHGLDVRLATQQKPILEAITAEGECVLRSLPSVELR